MNKKVSTLLTVGLMLGGSLLSSSAFAAKVTKAEFQAAISGFKLDISKLPEDAQKDGVVELSEAVDLSTKETNKGMKAPFIIVDKPITITSYDKNDKVTFTGNIVIASDGVKISDIKFQTPSVALGGTGSWFYSLISVFADKVTIENNEFSGDATRESGFREAIVICPQNVDVEYSINGNKFSGFTANAGNAQLNGAIKLNLNTCNLWNSDNKNSGKDTEVYNAIKALGKKGITDSKTAKGEPTASPDINIYAINAANDFAEGNSSNILVSKDNIGDEGRFISEVIFDELSKDSKTLEAVLAAKKDNIQIVVENISVAEMQDMITTVEGFTGDAVMYSISAKTSVVLGEGEAKLKESIETVENIKLETVEAAGAYDEIKKGKTYTLMVGDMFVSADEEGKPVMSRTETYWNVSCPKDDVYSFTSSDGAKLTAGGKYTEFEKKEKEGSAAFYLMVAGKYVGNGFDLVEKEGKALVFGAHEVTSSIGISAETLNKVNEGSFSIDYRFDDDHIAEVNPFSGDVKAFNYGENVFFATSWPASLNNTSEISSKTEFDKCVFIVATLENKWNINNLKKSGEGAKFTEVKGDRLLETVSADDLKAGKYALSNAAFTVTQNPASEKYTLMLKETLYYLDQDNKLADVDDDLKIALIDDEAGLIVTTIGASYGENDDEIVVEGTITNSRTATVDQILSTEKASVFNIKFVSQNAAPENVDLTSSEKATYSEYNKYLGINEEVLFAQGSEFVNLNAPENQWVIIAANKDDKTVTFCNREDGATQFTAQLVKTSKANVYEVRLKSNEVSVDYGFVLTNGTYAKASTLYFDNENILLDNLGNTLVELTAVTPDAEAGYATTELDNAGLVRFSFTANEYKNALVEDLFVAEGYGNWLSTDKNESNAVQFSVVKFDAAATSTALSDSIYADNDYVIWDAANKKVKTVYDGDSIAVVSYAFKQLRADGKDYYLASDMQSVTPVTNESEAPRFLVKINKNGSYTLISVNDNDYFRRIVNTDARTLDLSATTGDINTNESIYYNYQRRAFDFNILKETPGTSFNHVPQHVTMESVNGGYVAMNPETKAGVVAPVSTLKAEYTKEDLTFWLDTTDSEAVTPSFMISKAGNYMYNAIDSLNTYNEGTASEEIIAEFGLKVGYYTYARAIFQSADLTKVKDINNYKFQIVQSADNADEYVVKSLNDYRYLAAHNQELYLTNVAANALKLIVAPAEAPTSNESVSATEVKVIANNGSINVKNAAGKNVVVSTILGQVVANEVLTSDNATINVPAGIVVVAVEGESFKVNVK